MQFTAFPINAPVKFYHIWQLFHHLPHTSVISFKYVSSIPSQSVTHCIYSNATFGILYALLFITIENREHLTGIQHALDGDDHATGSTETG